MIDQFHLRCLAASGDKDAENILNGLDVVGWEALDSTARSSRVETNFMLECKDTTDAMMRCGWELRRSSLHPAEVYYHYELPVHLVTPRHK